MVTRNEERWMMKFRFEHTRHKLDIRIWGDRRSFHELHELLGECWDCENADVSRAEGCSYIGIICKCPNLGPQQILTFG